MDYPDDAFLVAAIHADLERRLDAAFAELAREELNGPCNFTGLLSSEMLGGMTPAQIARVAHEANRALQIEQADPTIATSPPWNSLDEETRESVIDGVIGVRLGKDPEQSHANWCGFKERHGWTLGPVKDEVKKEHPLLVPYDELPPSQRLKDDLFGAIVKALS